MSPGRVETLPSLAIHQLYGSLDDAIGQPLLLLNGFLGMV